MGVGAILEPLVVIVLLFGGTWINRVVSPNPRRKSNLPRAASSDSLESGYSTSTKDGLLGSRTPSPLPDEKWHKRQIGLLGFKWEVTSPNTAVFQDRILSRLLRKFPFLVECWYWALVYWTYQLGRAFTAVTLKDDTVDVARRHALQLINVEMKLGVFWEILIQKSFLRHPTQMVWINWIYSFIHIPGTIAFLVCLYYYTAVRNRVDEAQLGKPKGMVSGSPAGPQLYQARRRTLAVCNLLAFVVFTLWPCMPPRLLSDPAPEGREAEVGRSYGFVDTVHGENGAGSVWTQNRFCNQYGKFISGRLRALANFDPAAMPSLHFGYSLLIGLTIMTIPLPAQRRTVLRSRLTRLRLTLPSWRRLLCLVLGFFYPFTILVAIIATANHFILDAVAGSLVCALGWYFNGVLLNLLPIEDYFLCLVRIHKPDPALDESAPSENGSDYGSP
ncbi:unnamed protein product [Penicillium salamii]|uniref:Inositolphosphotransferase Aur1/Ipt1 domain-containing protein n=1 Tax=Penicillium salamii TaxID=1612424 RepID=A0A9W4IUV5_9EURO|nr:unnamed protein product [Penicillium salamii]CAG8146509.1 unnamed protein product [Penicillium salamii]CAG8232062.1 unnamed protein product [Penicillium salamii]CAG8275047.1 unnamed protein product [Penicillium salamii]CAG8300730.1 unnamed protein product [Penicillium salamii]